MQEKKYRPNVAIIVLAPTYPFDCKVLVAQRSDIKGAWQFPQGGIDDGETPRDALFRELEEEIGTNKVEIIAETTTTRSLPAFLFSITLLATSSMRSSVPTLVPPYF